MKTRNRFGALASAALLLAVTAGGALAAEVNIYSARHYQTDEQLYADFTKATGIKINRIEDNSDKLISRIEAEGRNSPADILITVDAGRLWGGEEKELFAPVSSSELESRIPATLRHPEGQYFGFS
ncbi:MAG: Fe(3+) ABC transporter substrate-binding protein, partial [Alphaproteobacteria bacterium]